MHKSVWLAMGVAVGFLVGCASAPPTPVPSAVQVAPPALEPPMGRLKGGVRPLAYHLELRIDPRLERFSGTARIDVELSEPTRILWLHGEGLHVSQVSWRQQDQLLQASWNMVGDHGVSALDFGQELAPGSGQLEVSYEADFNRTLRGLYRVDADGRAYAFTQFEPHSARLAFPGFDEPAFKTPFHIALTVPQGQTAVSNTVQKTSQALADGMQRIEFEPTLPLPTYLIALAVGPFDVVQGPPIAANDVRDQPIPLRGIAVAGKGAQLAYALKHTAPLLQELERYFGIPYPYGKLDLIAVPDFGAGAMENAAAITFREWLLLLDAERAPERQRRAFAYVMAHELAHHWFGNLVTMPWWDDIWLNEAFATWMGDRVVDRVWPEHMAKLSLLSSVHGAMATDSRVTARMIRQPITSTHDIANAFDAITYSKGGGVLAMFERYLGEQVFRGGVRAYMQQHVHGSATAGDLVAALSKAAGRDLSGPFGSFLEQAGVPLVKADLVCEDGKSFATLEQSRYLPLGSTGDTRRGWQIPMCLRFAVAGETRERCTLLDVEAGRVNLHSEVCPDWLMPNAEAAGYYRWSLPGDDLQRLMQQGWTSLSPAERMSVVDSLQSGFASGGIKAADVLAALPTLVKDPERRVAQAPMGMLSQLRQHYVPEELRGAVERYTAELYGPLAKRLGYVVAQGEAGETRLLRAAVLGVLADVARDGPTRARLSSMGRSYLGLDGDGQLHPEAAPADFAALALRVALEEGDEATYEAGYRHFLKASEPAMRGRLLRGISATFTGRAFELPLDPALRVNEVLRPLSAQLGRPETRERAWLWFEANYEQLRGRLSTGAAGHTPWLGAGFCSTDQIKRLDAFFAPRIQSLTGGPRTLAGAKEALSLCAAQVKGQAASSAQFFRDR